MSGLKDVPQHVPRKKDPLHTSDPDTDEGDESRPFNLSEGEGGAALAAGGAVELLSKSNIGYLLQYFAVGMIYGGLPATVYGVMIGYLNVPSYVYATVFTVITLPWSFKFLFGALNDCVPLFGYRRKPYMCIGWAICAAMLVVLSLESLPPPYWCRDVDGRYITKKKLPDGSTTAAAPCNEAAAQAGGRYALMMMFAALGYVLADVAADGLTVQYGRREPTATRGRTQTSAYLTRSFGQVAALLLVGLGMNGYEYNGTFARGLSFNAVCFILAIPSALMVPISWYFIDETPVTSRTTLRVYLGQAFRFLRSKSVFYVVCYNFLTSAIGGISTTAGGQVKNYWAGVQNLQNQLFSLLGTALFALGLWLVRGHLLNVSWRRILLSTTVLLNCIDMPFVFCTVYDVVRNQYFYLGETVLTEVPSAANFVVSTFVMVELADDGLEGLVYGLLTTTHNLGGPVARAIGNQLYGRFNPSISDSSNYIADTPAFRDVVASSFVLSYFFSFLSLLVLLFLPTQKAEAQRRKRMWPHKSVYAWVTLVGLFLALCYSLSVNLLSMFPSTMCLKFAGGKGCP